LLQAIWVFIPALKQPPGFDFIVLLAGIALLGNRDKSRIDDLTTTGLETLREEVSLKHFEEILDHSRLAEPLPEKGDCAGIWNSVQHTNTDKLLRGASVVHLEFKLFIAQVEKLMDNEHLEKDQRVNHLAPCIALALVLISPVKQWSE